MSVRVIKRAAARTATIRPKPAVPSAHELMAAGRTDLLWFSSLAFPVLHPGKRLVHAEYLDAMSTLLMGVKRGTHGRLIFNLPPRHLKSMMVSVFYVAWSLGLNPAAKFICVSYGDDLAHELSAQTRKLMMSPLYRKIFPGTVLDKHSVDHIRTTKGGQRYATSVGSDITGFGADEIILDDLMQPKDASSERVKEQIRSWVDSSVMTRFNETGRGSLILVMHRLAPDDISATLQATGQYYVLRLPFIAETDEVIRDRDGSVLMTRLAGLPLNPNRTSSEEAARLKASIAKHVFNSQYQQCPSAGGSGLLRSDCFLRYWDLSRRQFDALIHSWDIGGTLNGNATVCTKWGIKLIEGQPALIYLYEVVRTRLELPEVKALIKSQDRRERPSLILVDGRGLGLGVAQSLRRNGYSHVRCCDDTTETLDLGGSNKLRPNMSKIERFGFAAMEIDSGRVFIPEEAPWLDAFLYEVLAFPNIADDDQVDSMTQVLGNLDRAVHLATKFSRPSGI